MEIQRAYITTKEGHTLSLFYNPDTNLVVLDVVHKNESGGNEIVRRKLNFDTLLAHCEEGEPCEA